LARCYVRYRFIALLFVPQSQNIGEAIVFGVIALVSRQAAVACFIKNAASA
tara:strand:+ start:1916 stop:2068 length:153 start_codon:yes stop_codon:yes gene_type:complete